MGGLARYDLLKHGVKNNSPGVLDDPPLYPSGNGLHLGAADPLQDLVRDRGACGGRAGRTRRHPQGSRQDGLDQGTQRHLRRRPDRRDRARDQARRHRLSDPSGRNRRPRGTLCPPGHDVLRRARHLPQRAAHPRRRPPDIRYRQGSGRAEKARLRAQDDADHRPLHGIHAEPVTFGLKLAYAYAEFSRARDRLVAARKEVATCAISGAVGTFAQIDPRVEKHVAKAMGLVPEPISTQVIPRDRHAMYFATLGVIASSVERLSIEIRHLQRTEVLEAEEFFSEGQKGSSAMPHKRNPVLSENLTGLSRMVRAYAMPAMENVALWHERDISHSSAERMIGPDATVTLDFALNRLAGLVDKLLLYPANMQKNLDRLGGLVHSQRLLIALTQKGASREDAYKLVQRNAMPVWRGEGDFQTLLKKDT